MTPNRALAKAIGIVLLFSTWPFLSFLGHNVDETAYYGRIAAAWAAWSGTLAMATGLLGILVKGDGLVRLSYAIGALVVAFFTYDLLSGLLVALGVTRDVFRFAGWVVVALAVAALAWRLSGLAAGRRAMVAGVAVMMVVPAVQIVNHRLLPGQPVAAGQREPATTGAIRDRRNVYWVVADAYPRWDVLKEGVGFDNTPFLDALRERGFVVAERSWSNYPSTKFSIATTLEMDYILPEGEPLHARFYASQLRGFNRTVETFRRSGYRYIHAEPGGGLLPTRCGGGEDRCITGPTRSAFSVSEAEIGLMKLTPLHVLAKHLPSALFEFELNDVADVTRQLRIRRETPFFLFAHILSPHPPIRFNRDCSRADTSGWDLQGRWLDGNVPEDLRDLYDRYINDIRCLNAELIDLTDAILEADDTDPIIIFSADHGTRTGPASLKSRFGILMAMRLPEGRCRDMFYPSITPVNQFRIVFGCLEGSDPALLADRVFKRDSRNLEEIEMP